jgi:hypothetical protein
MVFATGWYGELPDDVVVKLDVFVDPVSMAGAIEVLLGDGSGRAALGARAAQHVLRHHSPAACADDLFEFMQQLGAASSLIETADRIATLTSSWGMRPGSPLAERTAATLLQMLGRA